jgi:hypothetical protein
MIPLAFGVAILDALTRHTSLETDNTSLLAAFGAAMGHCIIFIHHPPQRILPHFNSHHVLM